LEDECPLDPPSDAREDGFVAATSVSLDRTHLENGFTSPPVLRYSPVPVTHWRLTGF